MPQATAPPQIPQIQIDAPWEPLKLDGQTISTPFASRLVDDTLFRWEAWRGTNHDPRWRLNEWLYYGFVQPRLWEGTSVPRSSIPWGVSFDQVEAAYVKLYRELLASDEIISVVPEGHTLPLEAQQIRDRLCYVLDHDTDDEGHTGRMELKACIKDMLIYGNCFAMVEWDGQRNQAVVFRVDPRDVFIDPATNSSYLGNSRACIVRKAVTLDDVEQMRGYQNFKIPSSETLFWLTQHREYTQGDRSKSTQESARGVRYTPIADDYIPDPSSRFIDMYVYMGGGREIWQLGRGNSSSFVIYNQPSPYKCTRLVSAPCFTVPNRFYAQSFVDILDPLQQLGTALINRHLDEISLAMNPPRATKQGVLRTPSQMGWRPGMTLELADPAKDIQVFQTQGVTEQVWQTLGWAQQQAESRTGQSSLSISGQAQPSNINRTKGGAQLTMQAPLERLSGVADNFEQFCLTPLLYKVLKVEQTHASNGANGPFYGRGLPK